jgi:hypothetical protein
MIPTSSQVELRCDRCRHLFAYHKANGCAVSKTRWDAEALALVVVDSCVCKWYVGELPPLASVEACPHAYQDQCDDVEKRDVCVHCGEKKVK